MNNGAIFPRGPLTSRYAKRKFYLEASKIVEKLEPINTGFQFYLFSESDSRTYSEIYHYYAEKWRKEVTNIKTNHDLKAVYIDYFWFDRNYQPQVKKIKK